MKNVLFEQKKRQNNEINGTFEENKTEIM